MPEDMDASKITEDEFRPNERRHHDSPWTEFKAQFSNSNKHKIWEYSPFSKTLKISNCDEFCVQPVKIS